MTKHTTFALLSLLVSLLPTGCWAKDKQLVSVKVEVVSSEGAQQNQGSTDTLKGREVATDAWTMKVIINGEHALLKCYESHNTCHFLGAGTYVGELKTHAGAAKDYAGYSSDPDVWIHYIRPIDHRDIREHWKVAGSW
jgi:hypothetical protein